jgi:ABC-type dipeptide/oligopeptide/nickel transport system permease component
MPAYLLRRLLALPLLLLAMSVLAFALVAAAPGDPVSSEALRQGIALTPENEAALRQALGLDGTLPQRYLRWLQRALAGDLGLSLSSGRPVAQEIASHLGPTLLLAGTALGLAVPLAVIGGLGAALARSSWAAWLWRGLSVLLVSVPGYWLALLALYALALQAGLARVVGDGGLADLWLPAGVLALGAAAPASRLVRERALQVMSEDPFRLAIAQGLPPAQLVLSRVLPGTLVPAITLWANSFGALLGGSVVIEAIFSWPGLGRLVLQAIAERDLPVLQAYLCLMGLVYVAVNLLADLLAAALDPRLLAAVVGSR